MAIIDDLKNLLASTIALKFKAHGYHWNVEGDDFPQWHEKFEEIYESLDEAIDPLAEWIRVMGDYAPFKMSRIAELSMVPESSVTSDPMSMAADLLNDHINCAKAFSDTFTTATNMGQQGLANFLADCQAVHQKWIWQLRVSIKPETSESDD